MAEENSLDKMIPRINELAKKAKDGSLTDDEKKEQAELRQKYVKMFKGNLEKKLNMTKVYDDNGKEVTSDKAKKFQRDHDLRDD